MNDVAPWTRRWVTEAGGASEPPQLAADITACPASCSEAMTGSTLWAAVLAASQMSQVQVVDPMKAEVSGGGLLIAASCDRPAEVTVLRKHISTCSCPRRPPSQVVVPSAV